MELKFNASTRKALAKAAADILGTQAKYLGVPSCAYQIRDLTLRRDGTLEGEIPFGLLTALADRGFEPEPSKTFYLLTPRGTMLCQERFDTAEEAEAQGYGNYFHHEGRDVYVRPTPNGATEHSKQFAVVGVPFEKPEPEPEASTDSVCIEYPRADMSDEAIENLRRMVAAKAPLIKAALGVEALPIEVLEDRLCFDWFSAASDNGQIDCWAQFISCLCKTAAAKKRVTAQEREFTNFRYQMRCWLWGLGMIGPEFAATRRLLIAPLPGNSGYLAGPPEKKPEAPAAPEAAEEIEAGDEFSGEAEAPEAAPTAEETEGSDDE